MSHIEPIDMGLRYAYLGAVMDDGLVALLAGDDCEIPKGVLFEACRFLELASNPIDDMPTNKAICAHRLALDVMKRAYDKNYDSHDEATAEMLQLKELTQSLKHHRNPEASRGPYRRLQMFFRTLGNLSAEYQSVAAITGRKSQYVYQL